MDFLRRILKAIKVGKSVMFTLEEKLILEGIYGAGLILGHLKETYDIVYVPSYSRSLPDGGGRIRVKAYKYRKEYKYWLDVRVLISEYGRDYLMGRLQTSIIDLR